jgi:AcrR family transcriptional regulator
MKQKLRPRTKPPEVRREEIMNAAQRLFLVQGVASTTVDHVATSADVAKGTVYLHFASKQALLIALGERFAEKHLIRIKNAVAALPGRDWRGKLAAWAEASAAFYLDSIELHDMLFYESRAPTREGLVDNLIVDDLMSLLKAGATAGAWAIDDPRFTAVFLFSGMHGIVDDAHVREKRINRSRLIGKLRRICFGVTGLHSHDI